MIDAKTEILTFPFAPHRRAENTLGLAFRVIARRGDGIGGPRRRLHPDSIEQTRIEIHRHDLRRPSVDRQVLNIPKRIW
jgi:hypothetical protein